MSTCIVPRRPLSAIIQSCLLITFVAVAGCGDVKNDANRDDTVDGGNAVDGNATGGVPDTTLDQTPAALSNASTARFEFSSALNGATFECVVDDATAVLCTSPYDVPVVDGEHTFEVTAIATDGQRDPTPATFAWTTDLTPPTVVIIQAPAAIDNSVNVTFSFSANEPGTYTCSTDGATALACPSPFPVTGLTDGPHRFIVIAIDEAGNESEPAIHDWTVDLSAPDTQIDTGPTDEVSSAEATFTFSSADAGPGSIYECSLDTEDFALCESPFQASDLSEGEHLFEVRVRDATGNVDPSPAMRTWTVDTVAPTATITGGPNGPTSMSLPSFSFETDGEPVTTECQFNDEDFAECVSPVTPNEALAETDHVLTIRVVDAAGNEGTATRSFSVDTTGPQITITGGPTGPTNSDTATFTFTVTGAPPVVECNIDDADYRGCNGTFTGTTLSEGVHTFYVRAVDAGGNVATESVSFTVDTVAPTVTFADVAPLISARSVTLSFTTDGAPTTITCTMDSGVEQSCTDSYLANTLSDGEHTLHVEARDAAGNVGSADAVFTVDATGPSVTIDPWSPVTNVATPSFTFSTEGSPTIVECWLDSSTAPAGARSSCINGRYTAATLTDGDYTLHVEARDAAGNAFTADAAFRIDVTNPRLSIAPWPGLTNNRTPTFTFTIDETATASCSTNAGARTDCTGGSYTTPSLNDGPHTVNVEVTDSAGNTDSASATFDVDATLPVVTISGSWPVLLNTRSQSFSFTIDDQSPSSALCWIDMGTRSACDALTYTAGSLADGPHTFHVQVTDAADNVGVAEVSMTVDATGPTVTIDPWDSVVSSTTPRFTFGVEGSPSIVLCSIDNGPTSDCSGGSYTPALPLSETDHTFEVSVTDPAGNSSSAEAPFTVDVTRPVITINDTLPLFLDGPAHTFTFTIEDATSPTALCSVDMGAQSPCNAGAAGSYPQTSLTEGTHTLHIQVTDAAGNAATQDMPFSVDETVPVITIGSWSRNQGTRTPTLGFSVTDDSPTTAVCSIDGGAATDCSNGTYPATLPVDGTYTFHVTATDAAGNTTTAPGVSFTVDATRPTIIFDNGPWPRLLGDENYTFRFRVVDTTAITAVCWIDNGTRSGCNNGSYGATGMSSSGHTFNVRATDASGNIRQSQISFTVDASPPVVRITTALPQTFDTGTPLLGFTVTDANTTTIQCWIDDSPNSCSGTSFRPSLLADDTHTFRVSARDTAGNTATTPTMSFTVDTSRPTVTIAGTWTDLRRSNSQTFNFTVIDATDTTAQCWFDYATTPVACSGISSHAVTGIPDGARTFYVEVTDAANNSARAEVNFSIDATAPVVTITLPDPARFDTRSPSLTYTVTDTSSTVADCWINSGTRVKCDGGVYTPTFVVDGPYTFNVEVTDRAGNVTTAVPQNFTIDTIGPVITVTPLGSPRRDTTPDLRFTVDSSATRVMCSVASQAPQAPQAPRACDGQFTPLLPLADGSHTITVQAWDSLNNLTTVEVPYVLDSAPPVIHSITVAARSNVVRPTITFDVTGESNLDCRLDTGAWEPCDSGSQHTLKANASETSHLFYVRASDAISTTTDYRRFTIDLTPPSVWIVSGPTNGATYYNAAETIAFSQSGADTVVCRLYRNGSLVRLINNCSSPITLNYLLPTSSGTSYRYTFQVEAWDDVGNSADSIRTWFTSLFG